MCRSTSLYKASRWASSKSTPLRFTISQMGLGQFLIKSGNSLLGRSGSMLSSLSSATSITGVQFATFVPRLIVRGSVLPFITRMGTMARRYLPGCGPRLNPGLIVLRVVPPGRRSPAKLGVLTTGPGPPPQHPGE